MLSVSRLTQRVILWLFFAILGVATFGAVISLADSPPDSAPRSFAIVCCGVNGNANWYLDAVTVKMTAIDQDSTVALLEYKLDDGPWLTYTAPFSLTGEGQYLLQYRATDALDNVEAVQTRFINIDKTPPTIAAELNPPTPDGGAAAYNRDVVLSLSGNDAPPNGSLQFGTFTFGLDALQYRINRGPWQNYTEPVRISQPGQNVIEYRAIDMAGHITEGSPLEVTIDKKRYTLVPPAPAQSNVRAATEAIVRAVDQNRRPFLLTEAMMVGGGTAWLPGGGVGIVPETVYPTGTMVFEGDLGGSFDKSVVTGTLNIPAARILYPGSVALFQSGSSDSAASWEWLRFDVLFENWLWGDYATTFDEAELIAEMAGYPLTILPAGVTDDVRERFASEDTDVATALYDYVVNDGGWVYAQADAAQLLELADLLPGGVVTLGAYDFATTSLAIDQTGLPLTTGWREWEIERWDDSPAFNLGGEGDHDDIQVVARYSDNDEPAVIMRPVGNGGVIVAGWHPTANTETFPVVIGAIYTALGQPVDLAVTVAHPYSGNVGGNVAPAFVTDFDIDVTSRLRHFAPTGLSNAYFTETIRADFELVSPPTAEVGIVQVKPGPNGTTQILWRLDAEDSGEGTLYLPLDSGVYELRYTVRPANDTALQQGLATISSADFRYDLDDVTDAANRPNAVIRAELPPQVTHVSQSEHDNTYPLATTGFYRHYREVLENKSNTAAHNLVLTRTVPLLTFVQDAYTQTHFVRTVETTETVLIFNTLSGYDNPDYLRPRGLQVDDWQLTLNDWDGQTRVRLPNPENTAFDYPAAFDDFFIEVLDNGDLLVPALDLVYELDTLLPYELKEYDMRFRSHSTELWDRGLSFSSDPVTGTLVADGYGGSVYVVAGQNPVAAQLAGGEINHPVALQPGGLHYADVWGRTQVNTDTFLADFFDIVPYGNIFNPDFVHDVDLATTVGLYDHDGQMLLDYPTYQTATLEVQIALRSNLGLDADNVLVQHWLSRGFITPIDFLNWESNNPDFSLVDDFVLPDSPFRILNFQGGLAADEINTITLHAEVNPSAYDTYEGMLLFDGGSYLTNRSLPGGPSLYDRRYTPAYIEQGNRTHLELTQYLAPVDIGLHGATTYGVLHLQDSNEPHTFNPEIYIDGTPAGDKTARVQVGGTVGDDIKYPVVDPGGDTLVYLYLTNGTADDWGNVAISVTTQADVMLTPVFVNELPPNIFDGPFMHAQDIASLSRGVYAWRVDASQEAAGGVYQINFELSGNSVPSAEDFPMPPALIGIRGGDMRYTMGQATLGDLENVIAPYTDLEDAYEFSNALFDELKTAVAQDIDLEGTPNTDAFYQDISESQTLIPTSTINLTGSTFLPGKLNAYTLPGKWQTLPARVEGDLLTDFYILSRYQVDPLPRGTFPLSYRPLIEEVDNHGIRSFVVGNSTDLTAHGAYLRAGYTVQSVTILGDEPPQLDRTAAARPEGTFGQILEVDLEVWVVNDGDYIAESPRITVTLVEGVSFQSAAPEPLSVEEGRIVWELDNTIVPNYGDSVELILHVADDNGEPISVTTHSLVNQRPSAIRRFRIPLLESLDGRYIDTYGGRTVVEGRLADNLDVVVALAGRSYETFLPLVVKMAPPFQPLLLSSGVAQQTPVLTGGVFFSTTVMLPPDAPNTGYYYLSTRPDAVTPTMVDDRVVFRVDGVNVFSHTYSRQDDRPYTHTVRIPAVVMDAAEGRQLTVELEDLYGGFIEATPLYLIHTSENIPTDDSF